MAGEADEIAGVAFGDLGDDGWLRVWSTDHRTRSHPNGYAFTRVAWEAGQAAMPEAVRGEAVIPYYEIKTGTFAWRVESRPLTHDEQMEAMAEQQVTLLQEIKALLTERAG